MADKSDAARLLGKFRIIARERVTRMNAAFSALEQQQGDDSTADLLMREIHTLKGEAHMMGLLPMHEIAHQTEDLLTWARDIGFELSAQGSDLIYQGFDLLLGHVDADGDDEALAGKRATFSRLVQDLLSMDLGDTSPRTEVPKAAPTMEQGTAPTIGGGLGDFIRVPASAMQDLTDYTGQILIHHDTTTRLIQDLWDSVQRLAIDERGDLIELTRSLREEVFQSRLRTAELQDSVRNLRLLQVSALFERYPAAIRQLARDHGKQIRVIVEGGGVAVDKQVLDLIDEALLHLVRNSIDHGIETPAERIKAGKTERGTIALAAKQLGARVEITVRDDGRGVSSSQIRAAAVKRGLLGEDEARALSEAEVLRLLFKPGFTTRADVSHLSGRGVGLDVVHDQVQTLGGTVELATTRGRGTVFTLVLPISIALMRALCFRCGNMVFGLPSANVQRVVRVPSSAVEKAGDGWALQLGDTRLPLADLRRDGHAERDGNHELEVAVAEQSDNRLAIAVDAFMGERELIQRSAGAFLRGVRLLSGTGVLEQRQVALLLSVPELLRQFGDGGSLVQALPLDIESVPEWRILIVDDSEITRDMLVGVARRAGLGVIEAINGREALGKLRGTVPDLILTDLDMPIMNGFELLSAVRSDEGLKHTPVVVLSTRGSEEDKRRAVAAGADAYLVKSEFTGEAFQQTIARYLQVRER